MGQKLLVDLNEVCGSRFGEQFEDLEPRFRCIKYVATTIQKTVDTVMWTDNETELDFLNFTGVADTVAEIIVQAQAQPISIGVSGAWGVGKSSMIRLIRRSLGRRRTRNLFLSSSMHGFIKAMMTPGRR